MRRDISEVRSASNLDDGGSTHLRNIHLLLRETTRRHIPEGCRMCTKPTFGTRVLFDSQFDGLGFGMLFG
jgi:hypothetical protein